MPKPSIIGTFMRWRASPATRHRRESLRPYVIKQIEQGRLCCRKVGRHRRVEFQELLRFQQQQHHSEEALPSFPCRQRFSLNSSSWART